MTPHDFDPDDNFDQAFHASADLDDDAALETVAWQLLLLINPGDDDAALQQFAPVQEAMAEGGDPVEAIRDAIDWKAGFFLGEEDSEGLVQVLDELAARFGLQIEWGVEDPTDAEFLTDTDTSALLQTAFDRLREHHYTLWTYETGSEHIAGWISLQRDEEVLPTIAGALGFHVRAGFA
ncbi:hypothetical protein LYSHEL_15260 [Lysobacter helvus]|uniref:DUF6630 domain-containing protein n=2 Tax=Lysobacteraceae TaxID=32033 RepID=A0ABM7Q5A5_9GAMM|nr:MULTISPECIES: hypothetical protein [Lysobacter]BCT92502.1 hypothetical protein LYSCAS_15260 [Lysobacter caseinilyticus]BCT95655.1 hypothetical protein LYSHEL_15260 [Lysobacter helvus]